MIRVVFYRDSDGKYLGFQARGHAGYAEAGSDIVCAAVSALVTNTVNSIELLTENSVRVRTEEKGGLMAAKLGEAATPEAQLLLRSLYTGLRSIEKEHRKYIQVVSKEV